MKRRELALWIGGYVLVFALGVACGMAFPQAMIWLMASRTGLI